MKAEGEARSAELENLRRVARLRAGERDDPDVNQKILIEDQPGGVVVQPPPGH
jgi:hypothetical protein